MNTSPLTPADSQKPQLFDLPILNQCMLKDVGLDAHGLPLNEADPRFRKLRKRSSLEQLLRLVVVFHQYRLKPASISMLRWTGLVSAAKRLLVRADHRPAEEMTNGAPAFRLVRFTSKSIVAALALLSVASATVSAQDGLNDAVSAYWKSQETATPLPTGFMPIHMDNQKVGSAVSAFWRGYTLVTTGSVSAGLTEPVTEGSQDGDFCPPGFRTVESGTLKYTCEWAVAE
jgi:hypothetical protein